jgi:hypothetical protein
MNFKGTFSVSLTSQMSKRERKEAARAGERRKHGWTKPNKGK